jgi:magnesium transporter
MDDIVDKHERIWDNLENYKEVSEALEATNESVIGHRLNDLIKVLTMLSAVLLPLSLVTGFYGMNIDALPIAHHGGWSVLFAIAFMAGISGALIWFFRRKKWL